MPSSLNCIRVRQQQENSSGKITVRVTNGPLQIETELIIVDAPISYRLILGRQWIEEIKAVTSPRHQCMKFPYQGKIIKILGDEPVEAEAHLVTVPTTTSAPLIRDSAAKAISSVKKVFAPRSIDMNQYNYPDHMKRPWEICIKIRYTWGKDSAAKSKE